MRLKVWVYEICRKITGKVVALEKVPQGLSQWLTTIIPATWETEVRRITV
jgi:hypothetical protein